MCLFWPADVPHSYHHYYSNPSYHTLSQNRPPLPHLPNNHDRTIKVNVSSGRQSIFSLHWWRLIIIIIVVSVIQNTNNQLFCSVKNMERERRGLFGVESNATLPADWKHHEPRKDSGPFGSNVWFTFRISYFTFYPFRGDTHAERPAAVERNETSGLTFTS